MPARDIWWNNISGPRRFVDNLLDALMRDNSVILAKCDFPWVSALYDIVRQRLEDDAHEMLRLDIGDCDCEPGEYLISKLAPEHFADYLRRENKNRYLDTLLPKTVLWLTNTHDGDRWLKYISDFHGTYGSVLFILSQKDTERRPKRCEYLRYMDFISKYDVELFAAILLSDKDAPTEVKHYLSNVTAGICLKDAEVLEAVIDCIDPAHIDPMTALENALRRFPEYGANHLFALLSGDRKKLEKIIWESQLQTLFSLVELELIRFIEKWKDNIQEALNCHAVSQFGTPRITDPEDVEFGTLFYMMATQDPPGKFILYIPDESARRRIRFMRVFRNNLAHSKMSDPLTIAEFFGNS